MVDYSIWLRPLVGLLRVGLVRQQAPWKSHRIASLRLVERNDHVTLSPDFLSQILLRYKLFRDYFPIRHFKTNKAAVYDTSSSYLFCYHPHGVQSAGAFCMASKASGFDELFPGLPPTSVQTLKINFQMPFTRENLMGLGMGDASKKCLTQILSKNAPG